MTTLVAVYHHRIYRKLLGHSTNEPPSFYSESVVYWTKISLISGFLHQWVSSFKKINFPKQSRPAQLSSQQTLAFPPPLFQAATSLLQPTQSNSEGCPFSQALTRKFLKNEYSFLQHASHIPQYSNVYEQCLLVEQQNPPNLTHTSLGSYMHVHSLPTLSLPRGKKITKWQEASEALQLKLRTTQEPPTIPPTDGHLATSYNGPEMTHLSHIGDNSPLGSPSYSIYSQLKTASHHCCHQSVLACLAREQILLIPIPYMCVWEGYHEFFMAYPFSSTFPLGTPRTQIYDRISSA